MSHRIGENTGGNTGLSKRDRVRDEPPRSPLSLAGREKSPGIENVITVHKSIPGDFLLF